MSPTRRTIHLTRHPRSAAVPLGLKHLNADDADSGLGIAIGNVEVTLVELTSAYRKLACGGGGIFSRESSYLVSEILSGQERSSAALGHIADVVTSRFAWKTGTSSAYRDAWTIAWIFRGETPRKVEI